DGYNVTLNDTKGVWYDQRDQVGGGILKLVVHVRGGTQKEAFRWLADFAGVPLVDRQLTPVEQYTSAQRRNQHYRDLPIARLMQRAAILLVEQELVLLKAALFDPVADAVDPA